MSDEQNTKWGPIYNWFQQREQDGWTGLHEQYGINTPLFFMLVPPPPEIAE